GGHGLLHAVRRGDRGHGAAGEGADREAGRGGGVDRPADASGHQGHAVVLPAAVRQLIDRSEMAHTDESVDLLSVRDVRKRFPNGTQALRGVNLTVTRGTIHGLVGANGAGKSTLFKIIAGAIAPTAGQIGWMGRDVEWSGPAEAQRAGISTIYQH